LKRAATGVIGRGLALSLLGDTGGGVGSGVGDLGRNTETVNGSRRERGVDDRLLLGSRLSRRDHYLVIG